MVPRYLYHIGNPPLPGYEQPRLTTYGRVEHTLLYLQNYPSISGPDAKLYKGAEASEASYR